MTDEPNIKNDDRMAGRVKLLRAFIRGERTSFGDPWHWSLADNALDDLCAELAALRQRCEGANAACRRLSEALERTELRERAAIARAEQAERERDDTLNAFAAAVRGIGGSVHLTPLAMRDLSRQKWRIVRTDDADGGMTLRVAALAHDAQENNKEPNE